MKYLKNLYTFYEMSIIHCKQTWNLSDSSILSVNRIAPDILIFVDDSVLLIWDKSKNSIVCVQQFNSVFYVNMYIVIQLTYRKYIKQCSRCWELYMDNFFYLIWPCLNLCIKYSSEYTVQISDILHIAHNQPERTTQEAKNMLKYRVKEI